MKVKIFLTLSLAWIIFIGYFTWHTTPKNFQWDEWFWFGIVPAIAPYLLIVIWKPNVIAKRMKAVFKDDN